MAAIPPYFRQESPSDCSLACLRMVLAYHGRHVSGAELVSRATPNYGKHFKNIWNPTIAKLAREYGIDTTMIGTWRLFRPETMDEAVAAYNADPDTFNEAKYEDPEDTNDSDEFPPLPLAYREMFAAVRLGCRIEYGALDEPRLKRALGDNCLVQTSVKLKKLYDDGPEGYHSILIYDYSDGVARYHDPDRGQSLTAAVPRLIRAIEGTGASMLYTC